MEQEIVQYLNGSYSSENEIRSRAEEALGRLDTQQDFPIALLSISLNQNIEVALRQSSSILLKNWVDYHWSTVGEKFKEPQASEETKIFIRQNLPRGLQDSTRQVRSVLAAALANVASWDWPEVWPELVPSLLDALNSADQNTVDGALRCLKEFSKDINGNHAPEMLNRILPRLLEFMSPQSNAPPIMASRSLQILTTLTGLITDTRVATLDGHLENVLTVFTGCVQRGIKEDEEWLVKRDVFKCFNELVKGFGKKIAPISGPCLQVCWNFIQQLSGQYLNRAVNIDDIESQEDSDSETAGVQGTVISVIDFLCTLLEKKSFREVIKVGIPPLIPSLMIFLQPSASQINSWEEDPDRFVEEEDDEAFIASVRTTALDLLLCIAKDFIEVLLPPLLEYVSQSQQEGVTWQQKESAYYIVGAIAEAFDEAQMAKFNIQTFLESSVLNDLRSNSNPFLLGRALWFSGRFADKVRPEVLNAFLEATVAGLDKSQNHIVRVQAARAVYEFVDKIPDESQTVLTPYMPKVLSSLLDISSTATTEVLCLILEVISECVRVNSTCLPSYSEQIVDLILALLQKYNSDPHVCSLVEELVGVVGEKVTAEKRADYAGLFNRLTPFLAQVLKTPEAEIESGNSTVTNSYCSICLDIATRFVRSLPQPIPDLLLTDLYPVVIEKTLNSSDTQVIQNGGECVRGFFAAASSQICAMPGGMEAAERVILHLLEPNAPEFSASFAGRLVTLILLSAKSSNLENILRAVLVKLNTANTLTVQQALLLVFARLASADTNGLVSFLTNQNALQPLIQLWLEKQVEVFGAYERRVTVAGLCKLVEFAVQGNMDLMNLQLRRKIEDVNSGRTTRSKKKEEKFENISFVGYALTILATEWAGQREREAEDDDYEDEEDEDELDSSEYADAREKVAQRAQAAMENNGIAEATGVSGPAARLLLSELLACRELEDFEGEEEDDVKNDPLHSINICDTIGNTVKGLAGVKIIQETAASLELATKKILEQVVTSN